MIVMREYERKANAGPSRQPKPGVAAEAVFKRSLNLAESALCRSDLGSTTALTPTRSSSKD